MASDQNVYSSGLTLGRFHFRRSEREVHFGCRKVQLGSLQRSPFGSPELHTKRFLEILLWRKGFKQQPKSKRRPSKRRKRCPKPIQMDSVSKLHLGELHLEGVLLNDVFFLWRVRGFSVRCQVGLTQERRLLCLSFVRNVSEYFVGVWNIKTYFLK